MDVGRRSIVVEIYALGKRTCGGGIRWQFQSDERAGRQREGEWQFLFKLCTWTFFFGLFFRYTTPLSKANHRLEVQKRNSCSEAPPNLLLT